MPPMPTRADKRSPVTIPPPLPTGKMSVEEAIVRRRSVRDFSREPLPLGALSQILWAAQGITDSDAGFRAAPSAGALYPLELYVVVRKEGVEGLPEGVYHYEPKGHGLTLIKDGNFTSDLEAATWDQEIVKEAAATIVMTGVFSRTAAKYGRRGSQYVFQESGHAAQNVFLQAAALGIGTVVMGAFSESAVRRVIGIGSDERPLYVQPIGAPA
jgi:SagB-type dehydrogenase family enzyme